MTTFGSNLSSSSFVDDAAAASSNSASASSSTTPASLLATATNWTTDELVVSPNGTTNASGANWWDAIGANDSSPFADDVNGTLTYVITGWGDSIYPSGYSTLRVIMTAIFVTSLMIVIVVGNMLVIIAIVTERALKTIQNWFIASLAVSDFLLGLIVMPFSLANELMGYWIFGTWWCDIHQAVDVLLCTASILNICMISLDRYWSITKAVEYLRQRTPARAAIMILLVWIASFVISVPPLLGWKKPYFPEDFPTCQLSDETGYVIYSALGSFYIPSVIMVFVYIRIYFAARSRARRNMKKKQHVDPAKDKSTTTTSFSNASPPDKNKNNQKAATAKSGDTLAVPGAGSPGSAASTPGVERRISNANSEAEAEAGGRENGAAKVVAISVPPPQPPKSPSPAAAAAHHQHHQQPPPTPVITKGTYSAVPTSTTDEADCVSELEHSSDSDQYTRDSSSTHKASRVPLRRLRHLCRPPHKKTAKERRDEVDLGKLPSAPPKIRDPEREKRRIARKRERRATVILGLIMASFILSWLPFFMLYLLAGLCKSFHVPELGFAFAFWLGYCNSALNPIIYTIFNKDFRRAFRKILFK